MNTRVEKEIKDEARRRSDNAALVDLKKPMYEGKELNDEERKIIREARRDAEFLHSVKKTVKGFKNLAHKESTRSR